MKQCWLELLNSKWLVLPLFLTSNSITLLFSVSHRRTKGKTVQRIYMIPSNQYVWHDQCSFYWTTQSNFHEKLSEISVMFYKANATELHVQWYSSKKFAFRLQGFSEVTAQLYDCHINTNQKSMSSIPMPVVHYKLSFDNYLAQKFVL